MEWNSLLTEHSGIFNGELGSLSSCVCLQVDETIKEHVTSSRYISVSMKNSGNQSNLKLLLLLMNQWTRTREWWLRCFVKSRFAVIPVPWTKCRQSTHGQKTEIHAYHKQQEVMVNNPWKGTQTTIRGVISHLEIWHQYNVHQKKTFKSQTWNHEFIQQKIFQAMMKGSSRYPEQDKGFDQLRKTIIQS